MGFDRNYGILWKSSGILPLSDETQLLHLLAARLVQISCSQAILWSHHWTPKRPSYIAYGPREDDSNLSVAISLK